MTAKLVAVLGATGTTGKSVITALLSSDKHIRIRAPVRNLVKAQQLFPENVEFTVVADFGDVKAVAEALKDVDALYAMVPPSPDKQIRLDATTAEAAYLAGVKHVVYLSGVGATPDSNLKIIRAHGIAEKIYEHYGYSLTILRPSWFMENLLTELSQTKTLTHVHGTKAIPNIAAADIGKAAATVLLEGPEKHAGKIYNLYAKEHLDANIVATSCKKILGKDVPVVEVTGAQLKEALKAMGSSDFYANAVLELMEADFDGHYNEEVEGFETITGQKPQSIETFLREHAQVIFK